MMNDQQLPISGNGGGTIVFGDLTFVQNHNFGQGQQVNPMARMQMAQQAMMIQQQQQQNQMLMLGIATMAKAVKEATNIALTAPATQEALKLADAKDNNLTAIEYTIKEDDDKEFKLKPEKVRTIFDDMDSAETVEAEHVEYEIEDVKTDHLTAKDYGLAPKHMKGMFDDNGDVCVKTNKFIKIPEDKNTFVLFIDLSTLKHICEWKDVFRKTYQSVSKATFKSQEMSAILDKDSNFVVVAYNKSVKYIIFVFKSKKADIKMCREYARDTHQTFKNISLLISPEVPDGCTEDVFGEDGIDSYKDKSLFTEGYYICREEC